MGMDYNSEIGYGFKLTDEDLIMKFNEGEQELSKKFKMCWSGDAWTDTSIQTFIFIKDSVIETYVFQEHEKPIESDHFIVSRNWRQDLEKLANDLGIKNPKIGWWLLNSIS